MFIMPGTLKQVQYPSYEYNSLIPSETIQTTAYWKIKQLWYISMTFHSCIKFKYKYCTATSTFGSFYTVLLGHHLRNASRKYCQKQVSYFAYIKAF